MSEIKVTRRMADLVLELYTDGASSYDKLGETVAKCVEAGLVTYAGEVTDAGRLVAQLESDRRAEEKRRRNSNARARGEAMRSLGMKRTRYGWE